MCDNIETSLLLTLQQAFEHIVFVIFQLIHLTKLMT